MKSLVALFAAILLLPVLTACNKAQTQQCRKCGEYIPKEDLFCGSCGASVVNPETQPTTNTEETQPRETAHKHSYLKTTIAATCTEKGYDSYDCICGDSYTTNRVPPKGHDYYVQSVTPPTCVMKGYTTYTCACGDTYMANYVQPTHNYVNYICTGCGAREPNYSGYQTEYAQLTAQYEADLAELRARVAECQSNIDSYQQAINQAQAELRGISPDCPQWFRQQYVDNYRVFGDTATALDAAHIAWQQQCNSQRAELETTISAYERKIQAEEDRISTYDIMISSCTTQYDRDVDMLEYKYGLR